MTRRPVPVCLAAMVLSLPLLAVPVQAQDIPSLWAASPHADAAAEAFTHWNDEGEIPVDCATCHSRDGYHDYLGEDGSTAGSVERPAAIGTVIDCDTCHAGAATALENVEFPSGDRVKVGRSAQCLVCHQGRASSVSVQASIDGRAIDEVAEDLAFINVHYAVAGATQYGSEVRGGYQYAGKDYAGRFNHVDGANQCVDCHDPHALAVDTARCQGCHQSESARGIRVRQDDIDGDGDSGEGMAGEILSLRTALLDALLDYANRHDMPALAYHEHAYPYFFTDSNGNGVADEPEAVFPNRYASWTPRLLRAAYNFHYAHKDSGGYVHNPDYVAQLLIDSLADLASGADGTEAADAAYQRPGPAR